MGRETAAADSTRISKLAPEHALTAVNDDGLWRVGFLRRLLDYCDIVRADDPAASFLYAEAACALASRIPVGRSDYDGYGDASEAIVWLSYARAVLAASARSSGRRELAEDHYLLADRGLQRLASPPRWLRAQVALRYASFLFLDENRPDDALALLDEALESFAAEESEVGIARQGLADASTVRAVFRALQGSADAFLDFARALDFADRRTARGRTTYDLALFNLLVATSVIETPLLEQGKALALIRRVRRSMSHSPRLRRLRLLWAEGRLLANLGLRDDALDLLRRVYEHMTTKHAGSHFDIAMITLDLGRLLTDEPAARDRLVERALDILHADDAEAALAAAVAAMARRDMTSECIADVQKRFFADRQAQAA
ncbi:MAG: hypothetical protein AAGC60_27500 [Acidobacteriota bacterium]